MGRTKELYLNGLKCCTKCLKYYEPTIVNFRKRSDTYDGLQSACKNCQSVRDKLYNSLPEVKERKQLWQTKPENKRHASMRDQEVWKKRLEYKRFYYSQTEYGKNKRREYSINRRARKINAEGYFTNEELLELYEIQCGRCGYCGITLYDEYEADHMQPLSKGGTNYIDNILITCYFCNHSKGNKTYEEFIGLV